MNNIDKLADEALTLQIEAGIAKERAEEAKAAFLEALEAEHKLNPDFKATENVRVKVMPNRYFDIDEAFNSLPKKLQKEVLVSKPDPKLVKANLTGNQVEAHMKSYANPWKVSLAVLEED